jgi:hypothetical protein
LTIIILAVWTPDEKKNKNKHFEKDVKRWKSYADRTGGAKSS